MKIWVGVTDRDWYRFVHLAGADEVNFWQPSGTRVFRALQPGEIFLFKLHSPDNFIVGGGHFVRYSALPASVAWEAFGSKNGVDSLQSLIGRVRKYRRDETPVDPVIGCNVLAEPFFLPRSSWIPIGTRWAPNIVQGKTFDSSVGDGTVLWSEVRRAMEQLGVADLDGLGSVNTEERYGTAYLTRGRLGQGAFRVLVTDAYQRRCAVTGEKTLPVLEAAHIRPFAQHGPHSINNGLLLRADLHKLFDLGYVTVTPQLHFEVSNRLRSEWQNGREYYAYHGRSLQVMPLDPLFLPSREYLMWHNENRFRA